MSCSYFLRTAEFHFLCFIASYGVQAQAQTAEVAELSQQLREEVEPSRQAELKAQEVLVQEQAAAHAASR